MWSWLVTCPWNERFLPNWTAFLFVLSFFHISRLKPKCPCWHGLSRWIQVKDAWLAEIPFLEGKSWNQRCPAAPLILLWDATLTVTVHWRRSLAVWPFRPGHQQSCALLVGFEMCSLSIWRLCRLPGTQCGVKSIYWDAFRLLSSLELFQRGKPAIERRERYQKSAFNNQIVCWARQSCRCVIQFGRERQAAISEMLLSLFPLAVMSAFQFHFLISWKPPRV